MLSNRGLKRRMRAVGLAMLAGVAAMGAPGTASANDLVLYGAGSLRRAMTEMAETFGAATGTKVTTDFAFSGLMRERIEKGEKVDVFTSADMGHPAKLVADGRASMLTMFARNALCLLSPGRVGAVSPENALDTMLRDGAKIGVYPPDTDPLGAYTVELFALADKLKPGSGAKLKAQSVVIAAHNNNPPPEKSGDAEVDALIDGRLDLIIAYCSGAAKYEEANTKAPEVKTTLTHFPAELTVGPEYGLAIVKDARPEAADLALFILSVRGQEILAKNGFVPIALPSKD